jgi:hypothetical protein
MMELIDTLPQININPAEYKRLLGFPQDHVLSGRARELSEWAASWYAVHGKPAIYARQVETLQVSNGSIFIDGEGFNSSRLQKTLQDADADGAVVVAVSAGGELEAEAQQLWQAEKPDEYFFLEVYGSAVVEHLVMTTGARICAWADARKLAVLPHYSPGYPEWDIGQQSRLLEVIKRRPDGLPMRIEAMESGMLRPKKSLLAVFGITRHIDRVRRLSDLVPCENCSLSPCEYRRVPYARAAAIVLQEAPALMEAIATPEPLKPDAIYSINPKALKRWIDERLTLDAQDDGTIDAMFRYEGMTCTNMGRVMQFEYHVKLGPRESGYTILDQRCGPAADDEGHRFMCRYMNNKEHLMVAIDQEKPLLGQKLNDVLTWQRPASAPGCYCEPASRKHKWGLVLETIHYALANREAQTTS